jgi:hypothetical protein
MNELYELRSIAFNYDQAAGWTRGRPLHAK